MKKFILMFALIMGFVSVNAQKAIETSRLTDNMSVTLQGGIVTPFNDFFENGSVTPTVVLGIDKYINPWLGVGVEGRTTIGTGDEYNPHTAFDAVNVSGYVKFNVLNAFNFDNRKRFFEPVIYTGLGWGHTNCSVVDLTTDYIYTGQVGVHPGVHSTASVRNYMTYRAGCEFNFNLGDEKAWTIVVNPSVVWGDNCNGRLNKKNGNFELTAGIKYNFSNSNGTRTFKVYDIADMNEQINAFRDHVCPVNEKVIKEVIEKTVVSDYTVEFAQNSNVLSDRAKSVLNTILQGALVSIEASASPEGSVDYNNTLAQMRADEVKRYLESINVDVRSAEGVGVRDNESNRIATIHVIQ